MGIFWDSLLSAVRMIFSGDREMWGIVLLSLRCTFWACLFASLLGLPLAFLLAHREFWGKRLIILALNTLQSVPTVVVGLFLLSLIHI